MTLEIKLIIAAVVLIVIGAGGYFALRSVYEAGDSAGAAEVQARWDANSKAIAALADTARVEAIAAEAAALARNQGVIHDLQTKLGASSAAGLAMAERLRNALTAGAAAGRRAVPQAPGGPVVAPAGGTLVDDPLTVAAGDAFAECARNADRLDALIAEVGPQL